MTKLGIGAHNVPAYWAAANLNHGLGTKRGFFGKPGPKAFPQV